MKVLKYAAVVVALGLTTAACSDSGDKSTEPALRVDLIDDAVKALQSEVPGENRFFEINATPTLVNLFVANADATTATAYVYLGGDLQDPAAPVTAKGPTFGVSDMDFKADSVLNHVAEELPDSSMRLFSIVGQAEGSALYVVSVESAKGGQLEVPVRSDGSIIAAGG